MAWLFCCSLGHAQVTVKQVEDDEPAAIEKARFVDRGEFVEDTQTGLLWQKDGDASGKKNFFDASEYADKLELGGLTEWRLPSADEMKAIFPATEAPFKDTKYNALACCKGEGTWDSYWTGNIDVRLPDYAFVYQWYDKGGANNCFASKNFVYVRCVHNPVKK